MVAVLTRGSLWIKIVTKWGAVDESGEKNPKLWITQASLSTIKKK